MPGRAEKRVARAICDELAEEIAKCDYELMRLTGIQDALLAKRAALMSGLDELTGARSSDASNSAGSGAQSALEVRRPRSLATREFGTQTE